MPSPLVAGITALSLARWQFAITTVFHFLFVPLSIGLAFLVALLQTAAFRTKDARYEKLARWWGHIFLVNFAIGVVTGIVLEFQFGMAWSQYSTFVGNIFGAPLAIEGLLAFFMESTFLGVWIFGRDRVSARRAPGLHLDGEPRDAALGRLHPCGERMDAAPGRLQDRHRRPSRPS